MSNIAIRECTEDSRWGIGDFFSLVMSENLWEEEMYLKMICLKFLFDTLYKSPLCFPMGIPILYTHTHTHMCVCIYIYIYIIYINI